jgi:ABC-type multidrug transport system fused ATPase/permease subunit
MGNLLLASIVYYGLESKVHHSRSNMALIATSIHLLMNGSQVLKNILKETINFETFFKINLVPFLELTDKRDKIHLNKNNCEKPVGYEIKFDSVILYEPGEMKPRPLNLKIKEGEHVLIYEPNESFRNLLLFALTKNLTSSHQHIEKSKGEVGSILIGQADIHKIHPDRNYLNNLELFKMVGVILNKNFYFSGTLRDNLVRKIVVDE